MTEMDPPPPAAPEPAAPEPAAPPAPPPAWQQQPAWQPAAAPPARPPRPGTVTAASIILIVIGTLVSLLGLVVVLGGALIGTIGDRSDLVDLPGVTGAVGGIVAIIGAIVVIFGVIELVSGIFALLGRGWARILAMVIAVLGALFALLGAFGSQSGDAGGPVVNILLLIAYGFVIWAMATAGRWFAER